jgi:hypothetical protein
MIHEPRPETEPELIHQPGRYRLGVTESCAPIRKSTIEAACSDREISSADFSDLQVRD